MRAKTVVIVLVVPVLILLVPLVAMQVTDEVNWGPGDFGLAWALLAGAGLAYVCVSTRSVHRAHRAAAGLAVAAALLLIWLNLAVGLIGSENNPANLLYVVVLAIAAGGAVLARFRPAGMARTMLATTLAQAAVPFLALSARSHLAPFDTPQVLGVNTLFVVLFATSAGLFHYASRQPANRGGEIPA